jgi:hypothetical protein
MPFEGIESKIDIIIIEAKVPPVSRIAYMHALFLSPNHTEKTIMAR